MQFFYIFQRFKIYKNPVVSVEDTAFLGHPLRILYIHDSSLSIAPSLKHIRYSLTDLYLTRGNITFITKKYFQGCCNLQVINLSHNRITRLPDLSYIASTLAFFRCNNNQLKHIDLTVDASFPKLIFVSLISNQISRFNVTFLSRVYGFLTVCLNDNCLTQLDDPRTYLMNATMRVSLGANPWHCGEDIKWLTDEWQSMITVPIVDKIHIKDIEDLKCLTPKRLQGERIMDLGKEYQVNC